MSGDVQPRKRKDKKKKKDELGVDDPRGTAAVLGEGDVFIHSQHDHGTGGHWCAKIIFFSLLAVLITLIGLIILENRGLTELEANSVESRYSGVLDGWIEDAADDHHDEHTLELKYRDIKSDEHHLDVESDEDEIDQAEEESQEDDEIHEEEDEDSDSNAVESNEDDEEDEDSAVNNNKNESDEDLEEDANEEDGEKVSYRRYNFQENNDNDDINDEDDDDKDYEENDTEEEDQSEENNNEDEDQIEENDDDEDQSEENNNDDEDQREENNDEYEDHSEENNDDDEDQSEENIGDDHNDEKSDEDNGSQTLEDKYENLSNELTDDEGDDNEADQKNEQNNIKFQKFSNEQENENENENQDDEQDLEDDDSDEIEKIEKEINHEIESEETLEKYSDPELSEEDIGDEVDNNKKTEFESMEEDDDEPPLERITVPPAGRPFVEIEEEIPEKPINTLGEEEEYEKRQAQLRKEEEAQGTQIWLKLAVGGALLVATHAVLRRATAPRDVPETEEIAREETPLVDRRMTLVAEKSSEVPQQESPVIEHQVEDHSPKPTPLVLTTPLLKHVNEEQVQMKKAVVDAKVPPDVTNSDDEGEEQYSEEEDLEDEEDEDVQEPIKEIVQQKVSQAAQQKPNEESEPEDVEIIDDEEMEEEHEEENEDEEEISDVDDTELLTRLEAKYGRLPEPERPGQKHKDGGNSVDDDWPGEPSERYWRAELDHAEDELGQGAWTACEKRVNVAALANSGRARWLAARALDMSAEEKRDNSLLSRAIAAYLHLLKMNERLSDKKLLEVAQRTIDRIQFRGTYLNAEPIYRLLIRRFPENVNYRNNLTVSFLMANRADLADEVLKETLLLWPNDRVALAHHGFVLKNQHNKLGEAVQALYKALEGDTGPANEPRFYYHLGDALLLLGRFEEAHEVHKRGAALGHFLSPSQRSLYNIPRLKSRPWWAANETPYAKLIRALEESWRDILKEGQAAKALYEKEKEGLKERGEWTQLDIFARGSEIPGRCSRAPVTCSIVRSEPAAAGCRRGQVKFSAMSAGTHVRPHVGPTNCRLRMHLGLSNTKDTYIRVDKETRQWQVGKTFIFDDSFEHEVWHNGTGTRLVLIVDVWHPDLTAAERRTLPAI